MNPLVVITWLISVIIEIGFPFLVGAWLVRRFGLRWRVFWYGVLVFLLAQLVTRVPLVALLGSLGQHQFTATPTNTILYLVLLGFSAGAFEETGRWLGYRFLFKRDPHNWENALLFGAGHEATESVLLVGVSAAVGLISYIFLTTSDLSAVPGVTPNQLKALEDVRGQYLALPAWEPLLGASSGY